MTLRIGSLCTGYGGLDMAVESVLGGELAWVADNDPGKAKILAHRFPGVPNLGDISETDWGAVEPVDIAAMGFPCKDVSCAGARAGLREGNRSGVWNYCATAIAALRPPLVIIENVRGLHSAGADSNVEWCPWCLGEAGDEHSLRASGAVLGDLADLGYDAEWVTVSASDAGAPHKRERVFIVARPAADADNINGPQRTPWRHEPGRRPAGSSEVPADTAGGGRPPGRGIGDGRPAPVRGEEIGRPQDGAAEDANGAASRQRREPASGQAPGGRPRANAGGSGGAPAADAESYLPGGHGAVTVNPGRAARGGSRASDRGSPADAGCHARPEDHEDIAAASRGGGTTPAHTASGGRGTSGLRRGGPAEHDPGDLAWGDYEPAIRRWEAVLGRAAPRPTEPGRTGERLSPRFVEWMMGLPEGWVTDVPSLSRNQQLAALGDGVVPQQAAMALRLLLGATEAGRAA